jgi:hypothetical protein
MALKETEDACRGHPGVAEARAAVGRALPHDKFVGRDGRPLSHLPVRASWNFCVRFFQSGLSPLGCDNDCTWKGFAPVRAVAHANHRGTQHERQR